jgi:hypothetical protein
MTPHEFLKQQAKNVEQALTETLRYEYGPRPVGDYYQECLKRLNLIELAIAKTGTTDFAGIEARLEELTDLSVWISLIERSRLGEFSWPFAEALRTMAEALLVEPGLSGLELSPIVHVIADGEGYFIHYERTSASGTHKFAFINFPRPLKHHVLLHCLFGHELGHTALHTAGMGSSGQILQTQVMTVFQSFGPLASVSTLNSWLHDASAPAEIKSELNHYQSSYGIKYELNDYYYLKWLDELVCDLFGLLLFGPGFAAAHQVYLRPMHANAYELAVTHPPYAVRHKLLVQAMRLVGWQTPIILNPPHSLAEQELLNYVMLDPYDNWASFVSDPQLNQAIAGVNNVFSSHGSLGYVSPDGPTLTALVDRLIKRLPPVIADLSEQGRVQLREIDISHTLYAGWVYSVGSSHLITKPLSFLGINMLCDHALLQQRAINIALAKGMR